MVRACSASRALVSARLASWALWWAAGWRWASARSWRRRSRVSASSRTTREPVAAAVGDGEDEVVQADGPQPVDDGLEPRGRPRRRAAPAGPGRRAWRGRSRRSGSRRCLAGRDDDVGVGAGGVDGGALGGVGVEDEQLGAGVGVVLPGRDAVGAAWAGRLHPGEEGDDLAAGEGVPGRAEVGDVGHLRNREGADDLALEHPRSRGFRRRAHAAARRPGRGDAVLAVGQGFERGGVDADASSLAEVADEDRVDLDVGAEVRARSPSSPASVRGGGAQGRGGGDGVGGGGGGGGADGELAAGAQP